MIKPCSLIICDLNFAGASRSPMIDPYKVGCRKAAAAAPSILVVSLRAGLSSKTEALNTWFKVWSDSKQLTWSFLLLQFHFYEIPMEIHIKKKAGPSATSWTMKTSHSSRHEDRSRSRIVAMEKEDRQKDDRIAMCPNPQQLKCARKLWMRLSRRSSKRNRSAAFSIVLICFDYSSPHVFMILL